MCQYVRQHVLAHLLVFLLSASEMSVGAGGFAYQIGKSLANFTVLHRIGQRHAEIFFVDMASPPNVLGEDYHSTT